MMIVREFLRAMKRVCAKNRRDTFDFTASAVQPNKELTLDKDATTGSFRSAMPIPPQPGER